MKQQAVNQRKQYIVAGALAGLVCGFFGAGGGIVLVPLLISWIKLEPKQAFATSVFIVFPMSLLSAALYLLQNRVDFGLALPYLCGGFAGGIVCGRVYKKLPAPLLRRLFGALLVAGGVRAVLS